MFKNIKKHNAAVSSIFKIAGLEIGAKFIIMTSSAPFVTKAVIQ